MEVLDIGGLGRDRFQAALGLLREMDRRHDPHLPATGADELRLLALADRTENAVHHRVVAMDGDEARALGHLELGNEPAGPHSCAIEIDPVDDGPAAQAVLAELLGRAADLDRTTVMGWGPRTDEQAAFWTGLGAEERYVERISELDTASVDEARMSSWIERRQERAADLELVAWSEVCPANHLDAYVEARNSVDDASPEGIELGVAVHSALSIRREELAYAAIGWEILGLLAVAPDGSPAGMTAVLRNSHRAAASWQGDTIVLPGHRNRGVGRWLKAEMWRSLRLDRPDVTHLRTGNEASHAGIRGINDEMGYRAVHLMAVWHGDIAAIEDHLDVPVAGGRR